MSELIQVRKKAQLTLPLSVRHKLGVEEGDFMDVQVRDGEIVLRVKKLVDKEQAWFWTKRWQQGEKEAEEDIRAGRSGRDLGEPAEHHRHPELPEGVLVDLLPAFGERGAEVRDLDGRRLIEGFAPELLGVRCLLR